jgi:hypothetical protein
VQGIGDGFLISERTLEVYEGSLDSVRVPERAKRFK